MQIGRISSQRFLAQQQNLSSLVQERQKGPFRTPKPQYGIVDLIHDRFGSTGLVQVAEQARKHDAESHSVVVHAFRMRVEHRLQTSIERLAVLVRPAPGFAAANSGPERGNEQMRLLGF